MSNTENKATGLSADNTPSQTLFRFVSLRSPQLHDEQKENKKFITIPDSLKSDDSFYKPVAASSGSKQRILKERADAYKQNSNFIPDIQSLKQVYTIVYDYAIWLAKNKNTCSYNQFNEKKNQVKFSPSYVFPNLINLWNNLIYQITTQKDFYVKEGLMQVLLATHTLDPKNSAPSGDEYKDLLSARVIIPRELILDTPNANPIGITSKMAGKESGEVTAPSAYMEKQQKIQKAQTLLSRYELLTKEMSLIENNYNKEYAKEYKASEEKYNDANQSIIDD